MNSVLDPVAPASFDKWRKTNRAPVILVALDLSRFSWEALRMGMRLAGAARGELVLFHAVHLDLAPYSPANVAALGAHLRDEAQKELEPFLFLARSAGLEATSIVESGPQAETILKAAASLGADVIVLGSHPRGFWSRLLRRGIREQVICASNCPVLVVKNSLQKISSKKFPEI